MSFIRRHLLFSQTTEYALRVVVYLATLDDAPATSRQIAAATHVPAGYLAKVLQGLSRSGLVHSQRGLHGGSVLARPASELTVYDVVQSVAPIHRVHRCPLGITAHDNDLCSLHRRLDGAMETVERSFRGLSIASLICQPNEHRPMYDPSAAPARAS